MNSEIENLNLNNKIQIENQYRLQWEKAQDCRPFVSRGYGQTAREFRR